MRLGRIATSGIGVALAIGASSARAAPAAELAEAGPVEEANGVVAALVMFSGLMAAGWRSRAALQHGARAGLPRVASLGAAGLPGANQRRRVKSTARAGPRAGRACVRPLPGRTLPPWAFPR